MQDEPTPIELTRAVADFLRGEIAPGLAGHQAFKLRVAVNILDLVARQLSLEQGSDGAEAARLAQLLDLKGSLFDHGVRVPGVDRGHHGIARGGAGHGTGGEQREAGEEGGD